MRELRQLLDFWGMLLELISKFEEDSTPDAQDYWAGYKDCLGSCIDCIHSLLGGDE